MKQMDDDIHSRSGPDGKCLLPIRLLFGRVPPAIRRALMETAN